MNQFTSRNARLFPAAAVCVATGLLVGCNDGDPEPTGVPEVQVQAKAGDNGQASEPAVLDRQARGAFG